MDEINKTLDLLRSGASISYDKHYGNTRYTPKIRVFGRGFSINISEATFTHLVTKGMLVRVKRERYGKGSQSKGIGHLAAIYTLKPE